MRPRIYVAGPIGNGDPSTPVEVIEANVREACEAGIKLLKAGFAPLIPHLTVYCQDTTPRYLPCDTVMKDWEGFNESWVAVSDGLLRLPGKSRGADLEVTTAKDNKIPVFLSVDDVIASWKWSIEAIREANSGEGDPRFRKVLDELWTLHQKKSHDYSHKEDFLANVRASEKFGVPAWVGTMIRAHDKMIRIQAFIEKGELKNESLDDALMDLAAYSIIALILRREGKE